MNFRGWQLRPDWVYFIITSVSALANATMFTVLAVYYITRVGMNPLQLVLVGTVLEATVLLSEVPTGVVADTFSRRLSIIGGVFLVGVAYVLEGFMPLFALILLAEVIRGVGETFRSGALDAWLADEAGEAQVGRIYIRGEQIWQVASIAGMVLSISLASYQLNLPVIVGGGLYITLAVFLLLVMPERGFAPVPRQDRSGWRILAGTLYDGVGTVRQSPVLVTLLIVGVVAGAASEGFDRLWEAHFLSNFDFPALGVLKPVVWFGLINICAGVCSLLAVELFRRWLEKLNGSSLAAARVLLVLHALLVGSVVVFGLVRNFSLALAAYTFKEILSALIAPLYTTWLVQQINPKARATVISLLNQSDAMGQAAGGPVVGAVGVSVSLRAAMVLAGLFLSPVILLYARVIRQGQNSVGKPETSIERAEP